MSASPFVALHDLRKVAENDPKHRKMLLRMRNGAIMNGEWIDPWLGAFTTSVMPDRALHERDFEPGDCEGMYID